ncbi:MAG: threonine synthase [Deltaproteobacteria bacterium]|nr:threonine synthase [Deltaproteobacteria bacterium]
MSGADVFPEYRGSMEYECLSCGRSFPVDRLLYTCPDCRGVMLLIDRSGKTLKETTGSAWRNLFDARCATRTTALRGVFRYYELMAPVLEEEDIVYLGEGHTPVVEASRKLRDLIGQPMAFKNDGQNPSASFKDRGMACAFSYLKHLIRQHGWDHVIAICASTGDTSAAAALYASYVGEPIRTVVILPQGKVTAQQMAQPLGHGAMVLEVPGVFDDCMKVVEHLADSYRVALLNSKNAWRILGQESYAYEIAQWYRWDLRGQAIFVPIGNAGNITAILNGFLKLADLGIIDRLPRIFGVQSSHADPVFRYYNADPAIRAWAPVQVRPSVAQAAMIGNPVSFPRVRALVDRYVRLAGEDFFHVVQVEEQAIMEAMLTANAHGHIACTQGGECLAGLIRARELGLLERDEHAILDATAHMLKFIGFQNQYMENGFPAEYEITPDTGRTNAPSLVIDPKEKDTLDPETFTLTAASNVASRLGLAKR